jgi:DNA-binding transcriptional ArsR family regulator
MWISMSSIIRSCGHDVSARTETSESYDADMVAARLAAIGALLSDETRAGVLCALMDGRAHTGGELARHLSVSPSTISEHLSRLRDAEMVAVEAQGRHRYFRLAAPEIATMLETLGAAHQPITSRPSRPAVELSRVRTCYDHLAGEVAIDIYQRLLDVRAIVVDDERQSLTDLGATRLAGLGIDVDAIRRSKRPTVRPCLDWTQRRHHLAGAVGAALLETMLDQHWLRHGRRPRSIEITAIGRRQLTAHFAIEL